MKRQVGGYKMARDFLKRIGVVWLICLLCFGCGGRKAQKTSETGASVGPTGTIASAPTAKGSLDEKPAISADTYGGDWLVRPVDTFLIILDASGAKYLPHNQQVKLKIAKDVLRRMNPYIPERPLTGALRRYGYEAGAWTERTQLLYGPKSYVRSEYAEAIEIVRWAGGKSPMAEAIDAATEDLRSTYGQIAVIIISDGKIKDNDPVKAAKRMKSEYGDRLCIYTVQVGNLPDGALLLEDVVRAGGCGFPENADNLLSSDDVMSKWVDDVFNGRRRPWERRAAEPCPDADGDGVCDDRDLCPDTPKGVRVDENGCWILDKVQFDLNKWNIKREYYPMLDEIARILIENPRTRLEVQGHTCNIWTEKYNLKLSNWRASAVQSYLIKKGVPSHQLTVKGFGLSEPTASNKTEHGRALNRRVEFKQIR